MKDIEINPQIKNVLQFLGNPKHIIAINIGQGFATFGTRLIEDYDQKCV